MAKRPESVHPGFCDLNPEQRKRHEHNATWHDRWWQVYCAVLQSNVMQGDLTDQMLRKAGQDAMQAAATTADKSVRQFYGIQIGAMGKSG